jgi:hypothetical protein
MAWALASTWVVALLALHGLGQGLQLLGHLGQGGVREAASTRSMRSSSMPGSGLGLELLNHGLGRASAVLRAETLLGGQLLGLGQGGVGGDGSGLHPVHEVLEGGLVHARLGSGLGLELLNHGLEAGDVVLGGGAVLQGGDPNAQGGQLGGQLLDGVLQGLEVLGGHGLHGGGLALGLQLLLNLLQEAVDDEGGLVAGQGLVAPVGAVREANDDPLGRQGLHGLLGPVPGGHVGELG